MRVTTFSGQAVLGFGTAIVLLISIGVFSYRRALKQDADQKWVAHTLLVLEKLEAVLENLVDQETGQRGYATTHDRSFLDPYYDGLRRLGQNIGTLRELTSDDPNQRDAIHRLESLIAARAALFPSDPLPESDTIDRVVERKRLMDQIRRLIAEMKREEQTLLSQRLAAAGSSSRNVRVVMVVGNLLALLLLTGAVVVAHQENQRRLQADRALHANEEQFRSVVETAGDAIVSADSHGIINYFNQAAERIFSYPSGEILGKPLTALMPERYHDGHRRGFDRFLATGEGRVMGKVVELAGKRKDGSEFPLELSLSNWKTRDGIFFTAVISDITERRWAEETLRQSEERFRMLVSGVKDYGIFMLDAEGRVASWNEGAKRMKGYEAAEIIGQHFSLFYPPEDVENGKPALELEQAAKSGRWEDEGWRVRKDGSRFWANVVITALRDETGRLRGFGKVTRDVTERRRAEQDILRRSADLEAANKELEAFSYSVSHDLRAPLRGIDGFSQALLEDYGAQLDNKGKDYLHRVRVATCRMGLLIDDLLNLSRVTRAPIHRESIDLSTLANAIASELQNREAQRQVEFVIAAHLRAEGDARLMRVVLANLMGNAWKFTSKRERSRIEFGRSKADGKEVFFVRDNGAGFDQAHADRLFGAFQRLHGMEEFPGTGIGLATVQRIIYRHGGEVWAEGAVEKGATIYFTL